MEIGPVFRAMFHNRSRFWLITVEIALTLAVVVNCVSMIRDLREEILRPTGMDVDNLLVLTSSPFGAQFQETKYVEQAMEADLRALRALPGVKAATAIHAVPLSSGGSASGRRAVGSEIQSVGMPYFIVASDALDTLGVELEAGRDFTAEDAPKDVPPGDSLSETPRGTVLVTRDMADALFPDGQALGKDIEDSRHENVETVVGIIRRMDSSWPQGPKRGRVALYRGVPASSRRATYMVRAEPGMLGELFTATEKALQDLGQERVLEVKTLREIKDRTFEDQSAVSTMLAVVCSLLVAVTALGIVGLTSFSVTQRTRQIGTRRALGATRLAILRYFLVENWLVTGAGLTLGIAVTYGLNFLLAKMVDLTPLGFGLLAGGIVLMWLVGLVSALLPALRSTYVSPVVATRTI